jgi:hypothetical protein
MIYFTRSDNRKIQYHFLQIISVDGKKYFLESIILFIRQFVNDVFIVSGYVTSTLKKITD